MEIYNSGHHATQTIKFGSTIQGTKYYVGCCNDSTKWYTFKGQTSATESHSYSPY